MKCRPNSNAVSDPPLKKNDLFRKFSQIFQEITSKEFNAFGMYHREAYISVAPDLEEKIVDLLNSPCDEIIPISGYTGVGKTYLLLYTLKKYYDIDEIKPNFPYVFKTIGAQTSDLFIYCSHEDYHRSVLQDIPTLLMARLEVMRESLIKYSGQADVSVEELNQYINDTRPEIKYYKQKDRKYFECVSKLIMILHKNLIRNVIFIFDDLESLEEEKQHSMIDDFLSLFEMIKNGNKRDYVCKFIFSVRTTTFFNIYKQDFYNTHRHNACLHMRMVPFLKDIFEKRFNLIQKNKDLLEKAGNKDAWIEAKEILIRLANRVDKLYAKILFELNNNNISNAINDFIKILENRRWTQKNVNPTASFEIIEYHYHINDINILRVLSMGENSIYFQTTINSLRCILYNPGNLSDDFYSYYILQYFYYRYEASRRNTDFDQQSYNIDRIKCIFQELFGSGNMVSKRENLNTAIENIFKYYLENRIIKYDDTPRKDLDNLDRFYLMPRGIVLYKLFFEKTILLQIFRDAFLLDIDKHISKCSKDLTQDELFNETIIYINDYFNYEKKYFNVIINSGKVDYYIKNFGDFTISLLLINALERSIREYYIKSSPSQCFLERFNNLKRDIEEFNLNLFI